MLENQYQYEFREAGCDEAGRGCLAGPVFAAAVILPPDFHDPLLNDSKQMTERNRDRLRLIIEREAVAWAVEAVSAARIDEINILNASFEGMSLAVARLDPPPEFLAIDGNRFRTRLELPLPLRRQGRRQICRHRRSFGAGQNPSGRVHVAPRGGISAVRLEKEQGVPDPRASARNPGIRTYAPPPSVVQSRDRPVGVAILSGDCLSACCREIPW